MTPADLHAAVLARLETISSITVYDAQVPDDLSADGLGRVYPYAVLWANPGWLASDTRALDHTAGLTWDARVTVAAGTPTWALQALQLVRNTIDGYAPAPGCPLTELDGATDLIRDDDTAPSRWYTPLTFRTSV